MNTPETSREQRRENTIDVADIRLREMRMLYDDWAEDNGLTDEQRKYGWRFVQAGWGARIYRL